MSATATILEFTAVHAAVALESLKQEMQRRVRDWEFDLWLQPSNLLRVLTGPVEMFTEVPEYFESRRGRKILCSVLDFFQLQRLASAGIPAFAAMRGIRSMFDKYQGTRDINSIAFCRSAILQESENSLEASVGSNRSQTQEDSWTLLLALPRSGKAIYKAMAQRKLLQRSMRSINPQLGVAITPTPDQWQRSHVGDFLQT